ncbi:MAG: hypothetical protein ABIJ21_06340 [Nanoarchaeota archaeon]
MPRGKPKTREFNYLRGLLTNPKDRNKSKLKEYRKTLTSEEGWFFPDNIRDQLKVSQSKTHEFKKLLEPTGFVELKSAELIDKNKTPRSKEAIRLRSDRAVELWLYFIDHNFNLSFISSDYWQRSNVKPIIKEFFYAWIPGSQIDETILGAFPEKVKDIVEERLYVFPVIALPQAFKLYSNEKEEFYRIKKHFLSLFEEKNGEITEYTPSMKLLRFLISIGLIKLFNEIIEKPVPSDEEAVKDLHIAIDHSRDLFKENFYLFERIIQQEYFSNILTKFRTDLEYRTLFQQILNKEVKLGKRKPKKEVVALKK